MTARALLPWCAALAVALVTLPGCTDAGRCALGTLGCYCDANDCEDGTRCVANLCEFCPVGSLSCACGANDTCDSGLACDDDVCRTCPTGTADCGCTTDNECNAGLTCVTAEDRCVPESQTVCTDSCYRDWNGDGTCDDGGAGSTWSLCQLGTDCTDCGARRNPCSNPDFPVFCPASATSECWSPNVDCNTLTYCDASPDDPHTCIEGYQYDCAMGMCVTSVCTNPEYPVFCNYDAVACTGAGAADCCFPERADCRTATQCFGDWYVCVRRLTSGPLVLDCGATAADIVCNLPE